jgi:sugar phosphate isomerase/epimerase
MSEQLKCPAIGWCGQLTMAIDFAKAGLDYIEVQLVPLKLENDVSYANAQAALRECPLPAWAMSYLFPHDFRLVTGVDCAVVDERRIRHYFDRVVSLLVAAKSSVVVLGSGWTRNLSVGSDPAKHRAEFLAALGWCADALEGTGITLVIEPLNTKESNFVTSVADGVKLAKELGRAEVHGLADFYHMHEEDEPLLTLRTNLVTHIHLADEGRLNPGTGIGNKAYDYSTFFKQLKATGYQGLMSCECGIKKEQCGDVVEAMKFSKNFLTQQWNLA